MHDADFSLFWYLLTGHNLRDLYPTASAMEFSGDSYVIRHLRGGPTQEVTRGGVGNQQEEIWLFLPSVKVAATR